MKKFTEYISDSATMNHYILNEGFFNELVKSIGGTIADYKNSFNKTVDEIKGMKPKIQAIYKVAMKSMTEIKDDAEQELAQNLIDLLADCKTKVDINNTITDFLKNNDSKFSKDSKFKVSLASLTSQMGHELQNQEAIKTGEQIIKDANPELKKEIKNELDNAKTEISSSDNGGNKNDDEKRNVEVSQEKIEQTMKSDSIKYLASKVNINASKLYDEVFKKIPFDGSVENPDDVILGLEAIVCGSKLLSKENMTSVLKAIGIDDADTFLDKIKNI